MTDVATSVAPFERTLLCNYPNPFNPSTSIAFSIPSPGWTTVVVTDMLGRIVRELYDGPAAAGHHLLRWDGRDGRGAPVAAGAYVCRLSSGPIVRTQPMLLVK